MADQIKGTDIIEDGHLNDAIQQAEKYLSILKETDNIVKKLGVDFKKTAQAADGGTADGINKLNNALRESNEVKKQKILIDNQIEKAEAKVLALNQKRANQLAKAKLRTQEKNRVAKEEAILTSKTTTEYQKQSVELNRLRKRLKDLVLVEGENAKSTRKLAREVQQLDAKLKKADARAGQFQRSVGNYGKAVERAGSIMRGFGATLLASFSIQAVSSFVKGSIEAFRVQEKAVAKVTQAVKSTGGAAGKTSEELQKMASALQKNTLFGDEEILNKVTAQLLTFTNIAGPQFDRTQQAALDLATVLDGDLQSASIQLGKALNDPAKNLSALSRSGIQFSKEQIATIKSLQETNQLAEAQNIILTELERQYGGQAKAAAEVDGGITQLSNAFGDFKEQVGKQLLEALKPTIKSLKEFFENLSEEDVRKFVNTLFGIGKAIKTVLLAFGSYKIGVTAATKVNQLFGKSLPTKAFGLLGVAIYGAYEIFNGFVDLYDTANLEANKFKEIQKEVTKEVDKEAVKLQLLGQKLLQLNPQSKERADLMKQINDEYGISLQNIDDETVMVNQLTVAYEKYVKQLEKKIGIRVIEEQLVDAMTAKLEIERKIQEEGGVISNAYAVGLERTNNIIKGLQAQLFRLQNEQEDLGITAKKTSGIIKKDFNNANKEASKTVKQTTKDIKEQREEIKKFSRDIEKITTSFESNDKFKKSFLTDPILGASEKIAEDRKKRLEELKKFRDESLAIIKQITDGIQKNIDQRIQARQEEISESQSAISRLQSLQEAGNADAAQAIKAEQIRIAKEKLEIEKLQKKKRNLLITVTALEKASQNIGSGDPNPLKNATSQIKNFLGGLPTFAKGTKGTVGDDLGRTGTKDGHIVRVDDKEHILSIKDSQKLHAAGLNTNADIVGAAMAHQNNSIAKNAMMMNAGLSFTDANIVNKLDAVEKAVKNIKIVQQHIDLKSGKEVIIDGNKTIKNDYNPSAFKI
jgi:hypothetical protein